MYFMLIFFFSISVISTFAKQIRNENAEKNKETAECDISVDQQQPGIKYEDGISILEALSATGLRSIRYAKEIPGVKSIIANDLSAKAATDINNNIALNDIGHLITSSQNDAT